MKSSVIDPGILANRRLTSSMPGAGPGVQQPLPKVLDEFQVDLGAAAS